MAPPTLDDINNLPLDIRDEHLIGLGLLPPKAPPQSIIPQASVAPMTPVTPTSKGDAGGFRIGTGIGKVAPPEPTTAAPIPAPVAPGGDWKAALSAPLSGPHASAAAPLTALPSAPDMATPGIVPHPDSAASPFGGIPSLPHLNFKERQALPTTSEGVPSFSPGESLAKLQRMQDQDANPYGSAENHPGILGKIGHYAAKIGNIAGNIVAPATMANITGTELNRKDEERRLEGQVAGRQKAEEEALNSASERNLRAAQAKKYAAEGEADIVQDASGNAVGWRDEKGALHSLDEETTPQAIKDIADNWQGKAAAKPQKQNLEQGLAGSIQDAIDAGHDPKDDQAVQRWVQAIKDYKPTKDKDVNTTEDLKHQLVVAAESGNIAEVKRVQGLLMAVNPDAMARLAESHSEHEDRRREREEKEAEDLVRAFDKNGNEFLTSKGDARDRNLQHMTKATPKEVDDAKQNYAALNDMGAKVRNLRNSAKALDQNAYEKTLIQTALKGHPDDYSTRAAVHLMSPASKEYVTDVFSLREAALALPKQTTGGSRVAETQAHALWNTIPATGGDSKYADKQLRKFDENLSRLWKKVPGVEGQTAERPFGEETSNRGGGGGGEETQVHNGFEYKKGADGQWHKGKAVQP